MGAAGAGPLAIALAFAGVEGELQVAAIVFFVGLGLIAGLFFDPRRKPSWFLIVVLASFSWPLFLYLGLLFFAATIWGR